MRGLSLELPTGYYLERDPDILTLRRSDGSVVGAFSAQGVAPEAVRRTVEETASVRPSLWVRFFGHFEVLCDGEPLPLGRNGKALTILKCLLANRARPVSQDHLMGWLWPDSNLKKARWSLNSAVHGLRKLLAGCPSSPSGTSHVLLGEGIGACYRALEKDRCHDNSHRLLMTCYARMGQRDRAIWQYRLCESVLGQEYGTS